MDNFMHMRHIVAAVSAIFFASAAAFAGIDGRPAVYGQALELYSNGMYERARTLFEQIPDDPLCRAYVVLCAGELQSPDYENLLAEYESGQPVSSLSDKIWFQRACSLFNAGDYDGSAKAFVRVSYSDLPDALQPEYMFKRGWCDYARGVYPDAREKFLKLEAMPMSDYKAPARYAIAYMAYLDRNFPEAEKWFRKSSSDPRFAESSAFYILDCRFMQKDYDYVLKDGTAMFEDLPKARQPYVARIISESYLVRGDKEKARAYYNLSSKENMSRSDYFYAGSLLYSVGDWSGAIDNYSKMTERTDSLGQIANYQLGNSYVRTRNKVAALDAFRDAAAVAFNPEMQEDAHFNYAKLAFDLNKDTEGFTSYIKRYNTSRKGDQIYSYMALALLYDRDYAGAVDAYDKIDDLTPDMLSNYVKANYLRAEQLVSGGSWRDAVPCLKAAAYYLPSNNRINQLSRYWLAESSFRSEKYEDAARQFADLYNLSALEGREEGAVLPYNVAYAHYRNQEFDQAARWFDIYLNEGAGSFRKDALVRRADCDFARRNYGGAVSSYQKVLNEYGNPDDIYPYFQQALAYGLSGDKKAKVTVLSRVEYASAKAPMYEEALYELGSAYLDVNDNERAVNVFSKLNSTTSDKTWRAKSLIGLGMVSRNEKDYEEALAYYKNVVALLPGSEYAESSLLAIESIYQTMRQPEKYLEYIEGNSLDAGKSDADREQMYFNTAEQLFLAGNWLQAASSLQKYLDKYPYGSKITDAWFYLAESYRNLGNKEKALDWYSKVVSADVDNSFREASLLNYAELSYSLERWQDAYGGYESLLGSARMEANASAAKTGMMRSAYRGREYEKAIAAVEAVRADSQMNPALGREASYIRAKSLMGCSRRNEAMDEFRALSSQASTPEGAEANVILAQDAYDRADFDAVQNLVYEFSGKAGDQSYWLARSFVILADSFVEKGMTTQARATLESVRDGYVPSGADDDIQALVSSRLARLAK